MKFYPLWYVNKPIVDGRYVRLIEHTTVRLEFETKPPSLASILLGVVVDSNPDVSSYIKAVWCEKVLVVDARGMVVPGYDFLKRHHFRFDFLWESQVRSHYQRIDSVMQEHDPYICFRAQGDNVRLFTVKNNFIFWLGGDVESQMRILRILVYKTFVSDTICLGSLTKQLNTKPVRLAITSFIRGVEL